MEQLDLFNNCTVCGFPFYDDAYMGKCCSEFCRETNEQQKENYIRRKDGDWILYPCSECGEIIEDVWYANDEEVTSDCNRRRRLRIRTEFLNELIKNDFNVTTELRNKIEKELKK